MLALAFTHNNKQRETEGKREMNSETISNQIIGCTFVPQVYVVKCNGITIPLQVCSVHPTSTHFDNVTEASSDQVELSVAQDPAPLTTPKLSALLLNYLLFSQQWQPIRNHLVKSLLLTLTPFQVVSTREIPMKQVVKRRT